MKNGVDDLATSAAVNLTATTIEFFNGGKSFGVRKTNVERKAAPQHNLPKKHRHGIGGAQTEAVENPLGLDLQMRLDPGIQVGGLSHGDLSYLHFANRHVSRSPHISIDDGSIASPTKPAEPARKPRKPTLVSVAKQANKAAIPVARPLFERYG
jgi:hypothetical protein